MEAEVPGGMDTRHRSPIHASPSSPGPRKASRRSPLRRRGDRVRHRENGLIRIGTDDLAQVTAPQRPPDRGADGVLDEVDRAVAVADVDPAGVVARRGDRVVDATDREGGAALSQGIWGDAGEL